MKKVLLVLLAALLLCGCAAGAPEVTPEYVLTYAENQPEDYPTTLAAQYFAALVKERTGGRIVVDVICDAQMGTQQEVLDQLAFGGIDFTRVSLSSISDELPILNVLQLPFLYEDADHFWRVLDGPIGEEFLDVFEEAGLVGLSWYDAGARCFYTDGGGRSFYAATPIRAAADLEGMTVRVQNSRMMEDMISLLGGTPVTIAYSDVFAAFETGRIDAAENSWASYESRKHHLLAPCYTEDRHTRVPEVQLISGMLWAELDEADRAIILACARESALYQRELWKEREEQARQAALAAGTQCITLSDEAYEELKAIYQPLYGQYCGEYMDLIAQIQAG